MSRSFGNICFINIKVNFEGQETIEMVAFQSSSHDRAIVESHFENHIFTDIDTLLELVGR